MELTVVTILRSGQHVAMWTETESDSIEEITEGVLARHILDRLRWYPEDQIDRLIVICGSLSWKIDLSKDQHLQYRPAVQLVAKGA